MTDTPTPPSWATVPRTTVRWSLARVDGDTTDVAVGDRVTLHPTVTGIAVVDPLDTNPVSVILEPRTYKVRGDGALVDDEGDMAAVLAVDDPRVATPGGRVVQWVARHEKRHDVIRFPAADGETVELSRWVAATAPDATQRSWAEQLIDAAEDVTAGIAAAVGAGEAAVAARDTATAAATSAAGHATTATTQAGLATTARTGAEAALAATLAASTIVGAGRPDIPATLTTPGTAALVAAATSGTVFRSLDGPQGAWEWQKRGSAWAVTSASTGVRNVSDLLINEWGGSLHWERVDNTCRIWSRGTLTRPSSSPSDHFADMSLPSVRPSIPRSPTGVAFSAARGGHPVSFAQPNSDTFTAYVGGGVPGSYSLPKYEYTPIGGYPVTLPGTPV